MFKPFKRKNFGLGAIPDPIDLRDRSYDSIAMAGEPVDWNAGYDIEEELDFELPFKNQGSSSSCVGNAWSYYIGILNTIEEGVYKEVSAKSIYSQIFLPGGGAYIRDGGKLAVNWGAMFETIVSSYDNGKPPKEAFMRDLTWKTHEIEKLAKILQAKEYRVINHVTMDTVAQAIRDNHCVVGGVYIGNSGTWRTAEPKPSTREGGHCLLLGKYGIDEMGKFISTPNSWNNLKLKDKLHPDGWQKLREDYFNNTFSFNPWLLRDKPNQDPDTNYNDPEVIKILDENEKACIIEGEGSGRKGILINGKLREITEGREAAACLYSMVNNGMGVTVSTDLFNKLPKDDIF